MSEVAEKIIWNCLVEDPILFLRHFLEKLTHKDKYVSLHCLVYCVYHRNRLYYEKHTLTLWEHDGIEVENQSVVQEVLVLKLPGPC